MSEIEFQQIAQSIDEMRQEQKRIALMAAKDVLSVSELSEYTGLTKGYIYKLVCYRQIPHFKSAGGKLTFFRKKEIEEWMCSHRIKTKDELQSEAAAYALNNPIKKGGKK